MMSLQNSSPITAAGLNLVEYRCLCQCHGHDDEGDGPQRWWVEEGKTSPRCCEQKAQPTGYTTHIRLSDF